MKFNLKKPLPELYDEIDRNYNDKIGFILVFVVWLTALSLTKYNRILDAAPDMHSDGAHVSVMAYSIGISLVLYVVFAHAAWTKRSIYLFGIVFTLFVVDAKGMLLDPINEPLSLPIQYLLTALVAVTWFQFIRVFQVLAAKNK